MGEARRRQMAGGDGPGWQWKKASLAPANTTHPLAVRCELLCSCAGKPGGRITVSGMRLDGQWVFECQHDIEPLWFIEFPTPPDEKTH